MWSNLYDLLRQENVDIGPIFNIMGALPSGASAFDIWLLWMALMTSSVVKMFSSIFVCFWKWLIVYLFMLSKDMECEVNCLLNILSQSGLLSLWMCMVDVLLFATACWISSLSFATGCWCCCWSCIFPLPHTFLFREWSITNFLTAIESVLMFLSDGYHVCIPQARNDPQWGVRIIYACNFCNSWK